MKKTLVAIAALAAFGAQAQSSVTITGVLDAGYKQTKHDDATKNANTVFNNGVSTSQFDFVGVQDLGNGTKAGFFMELDVNPAYSSTLNQASEGQTAYSGTPFTGQQVVSLEGGLGRIKIGSPDSSALDAGLAAQPFGTALGSGYSAGFGRLGTAAASGVNQYMGGPNSSGRIIRSEKAVRYDTPAFNGLTASVEYSAKNDNSTTTTSNNNGFQALGLRYVNGPLTAQYSNVKVTAGANQAAGTFQVTSAAIAANNTAAIAAGALTGAQANTLAANNSVKFNLLGANYVLGNTTVYAGYTTTQDDTAAVEDSKSKNIGVKYVMGNVDFLGNYLTRTSNLSGQSAAPQAKLTGLGANYNFSKTVLAYYRYENIKNIAISSSVGQAQTVNAVGLVVKF